VKILKNDTVHLLGCGCLTFVAGMAAISVMCGPKEERRDVASVTPVRAQPPAASVAQKPAERRCRITGSLDPSNSRQILWPLEYENDAGTFEVLRSSECVVLDSGPSKTLVRVTEGKYAGASGWIRTDWVDSSPPTEPGRRR